MTSPHVLHYSGSQDKISLTKFLGSDERVDMVLFFGTVGLYSAVFLLPLFPVLHYSGLEKFRWPEVADWKYLLVTALIGTVISDLLWLWSTLLTTSLIATIGLGLTSPISLLVDIILNKQQFSITFFVGTVLVGVSFIILSVLCFMDYSDPVLKWARLLADRVKLLWGNRTHSEIQSLLQSTDPQTLESN